MFLLKIVYLIELQWFLTFLFIHISSALSVVYKWLTRLKINQYIYYEVHNIYKKFKK